jgi:hypothetical protein
MTPETERQAAIDAEVKRFAERVTRKLEALSDDAPTEPTPVARKMFDAFRADMRKIWKRPKNGPGA